jgi:hypothetical protein
MLVSLVSIGFLASAVFGQTDLGHLPGSDGGLFFDPPMGNVIFDNGAPDGSNGLSAGNFDFGYREVADDFVLDPIYPLYHIQDVHWRIVKFNGGGPGTESMVQVNFYEDDGTTAPVMDPFHSTVVAIASADLTGDFYFGRPEILYTANFDNVTVPSDTPFWVSVTVMDPDDNFFWLTSAAGYGNIFRDEAYIDMADAGHPRWTPTSVAFGTPYDMSFALTGVGVPAPGALALLALGGLVAVKRRRR